MVMRSLEERIAALELEVFGQIPKSEFGYSIYKRSKGSGNVYEFTELGTAKCIKLGTGSRGWAVGEICTTMWPHNDSSRWEDWAKPLELDDIQDGAKVVREGKVFRIEKILGGFNLRTKKAQYVLTSPVCAEVFLEFLDKDGYERGDV